MLQEPGSLSAVTVDDDNPSAADRQENTDQVHQRPAQRRTREQTGAGSRRLRSGAAVTNAGKSHLNIDAAVLHAPLQASTSHQFHAVGNSCPCVTSDLESNVLQALGTLTRYPLPCHPCRRARSAYESR